MYDGKMRSLGALRTITAMASLFTLIATAAYDQQHSAASHSSNITTISSTVPSNGDINPYGVFRIPRSVGKLMRGDILVSNFNNSANLQGDRHDTGSDRGQWSLQSVRSDRSQHSARILSWWCRTDHCSGRAA